LITFEDLNVKGIIKNHCLAKNIADASWSKLITITTYKAKWAVKRVELVNPRNTSQICSGCGQIVKKELSERTHRYSFGDLVLDRDHNVAINILRLRLQSLFIKPIEPLTLVRGAATFDHDERIQPKF